MMILDIVQYSTEITQGFLKKFSAHSSDEKNGEDARGKRCC